MKNQNEPQNNSDENNNEIRLFLALFRNGNEVPCSLMLSYLTLGELQACGKFAAMMQARIPKNRPDRGTYCSMLCQSRAVFMLSTRQARARRVWSLFTVGPMRSVNNAEIERLVNQDPKILSVKLDYNKVLNSREPWNADHSNKVPINNALEYIWSCSPSEEMTALFEKLAKEELPESCFARREFLIEEQEKRLDAENLREIFHGLARRSFW